MKAVDLFAGAGGYSTGLLQAATARGEHVELVAVNHWPISVETHTRNHPEARHFCASIETLDPKIAVPGGRLDLLIAAPECVFHSTARGGKPIDDQRRASAWHVLRWLEHLHVDDVLIENVPEFVKWGPLGLNNKPLKSKQGQIFKAFVAAIEALNYRVEWKVLNAADFGAATTRRRLFIRARRGGKQIVWPDATHSKAGTATLFGGRRKWRGAREIIDWSLPSQSIFTRKKPLQPATIRRILEGLRRFGGAELEPFLVILRNNATAETVDAPLSTLTAGGGHHGLIEPVIVKLTHGDRKRERSVDEPLPTVTAANRGELGIAEPFILGQQSNSAPRTTDDPIPTVAAAGKVALVEPFIVQPAHGSGGGRGDRGRVTSVDVPLGTQPASNRFALAEPFLVPFLGERDGQSPRVRSLEDPLQTVTTGNPIGLIEPFVLSQGGGGVPRPVSEPAPTIVTDGAVSLVELFLSIARNNNTPKSLDEPVPPLCTAQHVALVEPLIAKYNSTAKAAKPVSEPLDTVSTRDRFALVQPVINGYALDIKFRMLQPHELAAAMSFPKGYAFSGNKGDTIRQIGNAVDCRMAEALCGAILDAKKTKPKTSEAVA